MEAIQHVPHERVHERDVEQVLFVLVPQMKKKSWMCLSRWVWRELLSFRSAQWKSSQTCHRSERGAAARHRVTNVEKSVPQFVGESVEMVDIMSQERISEHDIANA